MGKMIASLVAARADLKIVSVWEVLEAIDRTGDFAQATGYSKNPVSVLANGRDAVALADVVVDFSLPQAFAEIVRACEEASKPLVTGTTGIAAKESLLGPLARKAAVVSSPNMAVGVNALFGMCDVVARQIGGLSDIEIVETHHRTKKDVPSGTAIELGRIISGVTGKQVALGRGGPGELVIHSLRVGDVPGKHTVVFALKGETIEMTHTAQSRECFAQGALLAARFAAKARPGLYSMRDVLASQQPEVGRVE